MRQEMELAGQWKADFIRKEGGASKGQEGAAVRPEFRVDLFGSHWRVVH